MGAKRKQYTVRALFVSSMSVGVRRVLTSVGIRQENATGTPRTYPREQQIDSRDRGRMTPAKRSGLEVYEQLSPCSLFRDPEACCEALSAMLASTISRLCLCYVSVHQLFSIGRSADMSERVRSRLNAGFCCGDFAGWQRLRAVVACLINIGSYCI